MNSSSVTLSAGILCIIFGSWSTKRFVAVRVRGNNLDVAVPTLTNQFIPLNWAFILFMKGKIKLADLDAVVGASLSVLRNQST